MLFNAANVKSLCMIYCVYSTSSENIIYGHEHCATVLYKIGAKNSSRFMHWAWHQSNHSDAKSYDRNKTLQKLMQG